MMKILTFFSLAMCCVTVSQGYYWRTWDGSVPKDALIAGADTRGIFYVAKVYIPTKGNYIGQVFHNQISVPISWNITSGSTNVLTGNRIEVLCSEDTKPIWFGSNTSKTNAVLEGTVVQPIKGGVSDAYTTQYTIYIGKLTDSSGMTSIGGVFYDNKMYFVNNLGAATTSTYYDLLVIENE